MTTRDLLSDADRATVLASLPFQWRWTKLCRSLRQAGVVFTKEEARDHLLAEVGRRAGRRGLAPVDAASLIDDTAIAGMAEAIASAARQLDVVDDDMPVLVCAATAGSLVAGLAEVLWLIATDASGSLTPACAALATDPLVVLGGAVARSRPGDTTFEVPLGMLRKARAALIWAGDVIAQDGWHSPEVADTTVRRELLAQLQDEFASAHWTLTEIIEAAGAGDRAFCAPECAG